MSVTHHQPCVLHSQGQTQQPGADVPLQQVDESLEKTGGRDVTSALNQRKHNTYRQTLHKPTRFLLLLRSSRSFAGVWTDQEERDTEHPFLTGVGLRTTSLKA